MNKKGGTREKQTLRGLVRWAQEQPSVRALLLTSSRANPNAAVDLFSDYDVILAVTDSHPFFDDRTWLADFGPVLVVYRDPIKHGAGERGLGRFAYITQYEDGTKIDFTLWPVELLRRVVAAPELPDDLDVGYTVLLDKDRLTDRLQVPTYTAHIPSPPAAAEYHDVINEFFHKATYVAKHLWRHDLMAAKYNLDHAMKLNHLRRMLEWRIEIDHQWSLRPGAYGRGLENHLEPRLWSQLQSTYVGAGTKENWEALSRTIDLFRKIALQVADHLGYAYPHDLDRRMIDYLSRVRTLDPHATSLF